MYCMYDQLGNKQYNINFTSKHVDVMSVYVYNENTFIVIDKQTHVLLYTCTCTTCYRHII